MIPYTEQRMYTLTEQVVILQSNESRDGIVLCTQEIEGGQRDTRLYLTPEEAVELSKMLNSEVDKLKKNSL